MPKDGGRWSRVLVTPGVVGRSDRPSSAAAWAVAGVFVAAEKCFAEGDPPAEAHAAVDGGSMGGPEDPPLRTKRGRTKRRAGWSRPPRTTGHL